VGPTYKVIKCFCPANVAFKKMDEWCEWCQCATCGYYKPSSSSSPYGMNNNSLPSKLVMSSDLIVFFLILALVIYIHMVADYAIYFILYGTSIISGIMWVRCCLWNRSFVEMNLAPS
jgi:hypothetical protein